MQKIANNPEVKECIIMPVHEGIELKLHGHVYFQHTADFKCSTGQLSNLFFYYSALWTIHIKSV